MDIKALYGRGTLRKAEEKKQRSVSICDFSRVSSICTNASRISTK